MARKFGAFLEGEKELIDSLKRVDKKIKKKIVEKPFQTQADKIYSAARRVVPVDTGALKNSIKIRKTSQTDRGKFAAKRVSVRSAYAFSVQFGTKPGSEVWKVLGYRKRTFFMWQWATDNEDNILNEMTDDIYKNLKVEFNK